MKKQYLYKLGKTSKRVASVLSAIALGFGNQLLLPQVGLTQTTGVGITTPSFAIIDDGCNISSTIPDSGDTITIATNLTNSTSSNQAFRVVFRATANTGGSARNLSEDLFYGGPTYMNKVVVGSTWDDSYGQVTNTPIIASGGNYTVRANFGLNTQQMANALGIASGSSANVTFRAEVFSSDFSVYYGAVSATQSITYRRSNQCTSSRNGNNTTAFLLTANKAVYATTDQITIENSTIGANDTTILLPSWGDGENDIIDIIRMDVAPTGNPETDYANNSANVATSLSAWTRNNTSASGSSTDERLPGTFNYSHLVGGIQAFTTHASFSAGTLAPNKYYLVRLRSRLGTGTNTSAGTASHPVLRPQYTYFAVGTPAPVGAPQADIVTTKTGPTTAVAGSTVTYNLSTVNNGPSAASNVIISDNIGTGLTNVVASNGGTYNATTGIVTFPAITSLANTATQINTVSFTAPASGSVTDIVSSTSSTTDPTPANNDGSATNAKITTTISPSADVVTSKTGQTTAAAGSTVTYNLTTKNNGPSAASNVIVSDNIGTGLTNVVASNGGTYNATTGIVTFPAITSLANQATQTYTISFTAPLSGSVTDIVSSTSNTSDPTPANNDGTATNAKITTTITPSADVVTSKTGPTSAAAGSTVTYNLTTKNNGPSAASNVVVSDNIGKGLTNVVASNSGTYDTTTGIVTFPAITSLANQATQTYTISFTAPTSGSVTDIVSSTSSTSDPTPTNNDGSATNAKITTTITPSADLSITKTDNQTVTTAGSSISYTITVANNGPSTLTSITVTDTVPSAIQNPTFTASTGSYNSSTGAWTGLNLASGQSVTLTMTGTVASTAAGTITNTATVAVPSGATDPTATNNTATDTTNVYAVAPTAGKVIINEVLYAQTGSTAATNDEFIEIYNASNASVDLSGWKLADGNLIENSTDGSGSITGSSTNPAYLFPSGTTLAPGQYAVIWIGSNITTNQASGATFQAWLGQPPGLNNTGDDVWLYDSQSRIVDYIAYGSGSAVNTPPPTSLNLWNTTYQTNLANANAGQSISLTANGQDGNASACWEPTTSGQASTRCTGYLPTRDTDTVGVRVTTVGQNNNGSAKPLLLLVKRITAINGSTNNLAGFVDDPNTTNDNSNEWPAPASSYLKGAIDGGVIKPGDTVEYTIYFLSDGGSSAQKVNICDLVPTYTTFVPDAFGNGLGIARATGSAAAVNLTNTADTDGGQYIAANGSLPTGVSCGASNTNGAVIVNLGDVPNATGSGTPTNSYGFIRFRVKVN